MSRELPADVDTERSVLGSCILDADVAAEMVLITTAEDFSRPAHQAIHASMRSLLERGVGIDTTTLAGALRERGQIEECGGAKYLAEVEASCPTAANAQHYARQLRDLAMRRQLIRAADGISLSARDETLPAREVLDRAASVLGELAAGRTRSTLSSVGELAPGYRTTLERRLRHEASAGVPTGLPDLDDKLVGRGLRPGNLIVLAARPSLGKTAMATCMMLQVGIRYGGPVLFFSLEMTAEEIMDRMVAAEARLNLQRIIDGELAGRELERAREALARIEQAPITIEHGGSTSILEIRTVARRHKQRHGLALVVVDYLQIVRGPKAETRDREVAGITSGLKSVAKELGVPVLVLSQLRRPDREGSGNGRPRLSDLRDSGCIEQDTDVVLAICEHDKRKACNVDVLVLKQRNGPADFPVPLRWVPESTLFQGLAPAQAELGVA